MSWIKRNLYFLIGSLVALVLMGLAGFYLYSKWTLNNEIWDKLNQNYSELANLNSQNPHPGSGKVDNDKIAKEQQQEVRAFIAKARAQLQPIPPIPDVPKLIDRDFSAALSRTIAQLRREATNASVALPTAEYAFSFQAQNNRMTFAANSLVPLSVQLGEIKAICDILIDAKVNSLDSIRRERVSSDDNSGPLADYLDKKSVTNELAVLSPYEVTFRCFSSELGAVLSGLASAPYGLIVKSINVKLAPAQAPTEEMPTMVAPVMVQQPTTVEQPRPMDAAAAFARRYGISPGGGRPTANPYAMQPQPVQPQVTYAAAVPAAPRSQQPVLDEKLLDVSLMITVVKPLNPKSK